MKKYPEVILIPVSMDLYWQIFREMKENDPCSTFSDNRVVDDNLIILNLPNRNKKIVIQCKEEMVIEKSIQYPGEVKSNLAGLKGEKNASNRKPHTN